MVKNPHANTGDMRDAGSIPGVGAHSCSCLENPTDRETRWPTGHGATESNTTVKSNTHADREHLGRNGVLPCGLGQDGRDGFLQSVSGPSPAVKATLRAHARQASCACASFCGFSHPSSLLKISTLFVLLLLLCVVLGKKWSSGHLFPLNKQGQKGKKQ